MNLRDTFNGMEKIKVIMNPLKILFKLWFLFVLTTNIIILWIILKIVNILPVNNYSKKYLNRYISSIFFKLIVLLNPQVKIKFLNKNHKNFTKNKQYVFISNHLSFFDTLLFIYSTPLNVLSKMRVLHKAELLKIPLFGDILKKCDHFPVYFKTKELNNFSVDKEQQLKVMEEVRKHLHEGGNLVFFPEGKLNNENVTKLLPFRKGMFELLKEVREHKQQFFELCCFFHHGTEKSWPIREKIGGNFSKIHCQFDFFDSDFLDRMVDVEYIREMAQVKMDMLIKKIQ